MGYSTTNPYTNEVVETFLSERSQVLAKAAELGAAGIKEFVNQKVFTGARLAELAA